MITLATTKQAIDEWRANKVSANTPIPEKIWGMVNQLLPIHTKAEIYKFLGISSNQIRSHCAGNFLVGDQAAESTRIINEFVEATPPSLTVGMAELTIKGGSRTLQLCLPTTALNEVLPTLGALL